MGANEIELSDLQRLARSDSPDLADAVLAFLAQPDPEPETQPPAGATTLAAFLAELQGGAALRYVDPARTAKKTAAWRTFLAQTDPPPPPRFALAELLVETYARGSDAARAAIVAVVRGAPELRFGLWGGIKRIYKLAEARLDAEVFGVIAWRVDRDFAARGRPEVSRATLNYLRRRAWRFLRDLGRQTPLLYPQFAAQVLRHGGRWDPFPRQWVTNHIFLHESGKYSASGFSLRKLPDDLAKNRAFDEAWKRSPDALMTLLEGCEADPAARFAIQGLRRDFPEKLRNAEPAWLARLAARPLESAHEFVVETLQGSAEFHQSKLRALGLHDAVLSLLRSPAKKARAYAIEYARANAADLDPDRLLDLLADPDGELFDDTRKFLAGVLKSLSPKDLGAPRLGRMLAVDDLNAWAKKQLDEVLDAAEVPLSFVTDMVFAGYLELDWALDHLKKRRKGEADAAFWRAVLDDPRMARDENGALYQVAEVVGKVDPAKLGAAWLLDAVAHPQLGHYAAQWLAKATSLPGLDIERLKALVFSAATRACALEALGNTKLVRPRDIGLGWLLALARRADPTLHQFAHRYLLEHMRPADFADDGAADPKAAGTARLFALATGAKEPEPVRVFAQTYLRCHHPVIGPQQDESRAYQLKPALAREAYTAARVWEALWDPRPDVRRFAVAVARAELRAWGAPEKVYELAESPAREVRALAYDALLKAGDASADPACTLRPEELDAARTFALTESRTKSTRECGMEVLRRHYARLGGAERLAWLMQSPDREVRLFAVRLLWARHRPRETPAGWAPRGGAPVATERFADVAALRDFLRRVLFSLAPGRVERREGEAASRHVPASAAKRNVIEVVRDLGVEDAYFAEVVSPVLGEFTGSLARGEWEACLAALMRMRAAHPGVSLGGLP